MSDLMGMTPFREEKFKQEFMDTIGTPFCTSNKTYPSRPVGDTIAIAKILYKKWRKEMDHV